MQAARAECERQVREATDLHEQRNKDIQAYLQVRSARTMQQAKQPQHDSQASVRSAPRNLASLPPTGVTFRKSEDDVGVEAVPETLETEDEEEGEEDAEGIVLEDDVVQPPGSPERRPSWTKQIRLLCRQVAHAVGQHWRGITVLVHRLRRGGTQRGPGQGRRRRSAARTDTPEPHEGPNDDRSSPPGASSTLQVADRRVSFRQEGSEPALAGSGALPNWEVS